VITLAVILGPEVPRDQPLRVVLPRARPHGGARRITVTWEHPGEHPVGSATFSLDGAQRELTHTLRLPNGEYVLHIEVEVVQDPSGALDVERHRRRVELRGEPTTLNLSHPK
jgi:hypothetical protein